MKIKEKEKKQTKVAQARAYANSLVDSGKLHAAPNRREFRQEFSFFVLSFWSNCIFYLVLTLASSDRILSCGFLPGACS